MLLEISKMNVLIIAQYFPPDMGGASTRAFNVAKGLVKFGCSVNVIAAFPHYPEGNIPDFYKGKALTFEKIGDIQVFRVWVPPLAHNSSLNRVVLHLCFLFSSLFILPFKTDFDVIWAANPNLFSFLSALIYSFVRQKPIIRNVDDLWPEVFYELGIVKSRLMRKMLDFLAKLSYVIPAAITPISPAYKRRIVDKYGVESEKIHVIEVGVDTVNEEVFYSKNNVKKRFIVMYSGILGVGYDFENVLKAAGYLSEYEDIVFVIRGMGEFETNIHRLINELELKNVILNTNFLPKPKLKELLISADVFLLPMNPANFVEEGLPTKIFEYQAYGKPIICCSAGEPARYIQLTESGLVIKPSDPETLGKAVLKLYENRKLAFELGLNGWKYVSENLTSERIGERMYNLLQSIKNVVIDSSKRSIAVLSV